MKKNAAAMAVSHKCELQILIGRIRMSSLDAMILASLKERSYAM
jgi:hypothetical protein